MWLGRPSRWGNPDDWHTLGRPEAVRRHRDDLHAGRLAVTVADVARDLAANTYLACACPLSEPCHADTYLALLTIETCGTTRRVVPQGAEVDERSEKTGAFPYPSRPEDLKGLKDRDGYGNKAEDAGGGGRSHGATSGTTGPGGRFTATDEATRFWSKVAIDPDGCWLWTGAPTVDGYGRFRIVRDGRATHVRAHRWAYEAAVGPIPAGWEIDHVRARGCTHRHCVRPDHLEAVDGDENKRRARQAALTGEATRPALTTASRRALAVLAAARDLGAGPEAFVSVSSRTSKPDAWDRTVAPASADVLVRDGLARRLPDPDPRGRRRITITPTGRQLATEVGLTASVPTSATPGGRSTSQPQTNTRTTR